MQNQICNFLDDEPISQGVEKPILDQNKGRETISCDLCGDTFESSLNVDHTCNHENTQIDHVLCDICGESFEDQDNHQCPNVEIDNIQDNVDNTVDNVQDIIVQDGNLQDNDTLKCDECGETFSDYLAKNLHILEGHENQYAAVAMGGGGGGNENVPPNQLPPADRNNAANRLQWHNLPVHLKSRILFETPDFIFKLEPRSFRRQRNFLFDDFQYQLTVIAKHNKPILLKNSLQLLAKGQCCQILTK